MRAAAAVSAPPVQMRRADAPVKRAEKIAEVAAESPLRVPTPPPKVPPPRLLLYPPPARATCYCAPPSVHVSPSGQLYPM